MARTPKKKGGKLIVYPKQWPDTRVDKPEIDKEEPATPHLGHEYRLTKKFSEQTEKPKSARETFTKRFRFTRAKHMPHPAPIKGGHYKTTPQMEKPHYEEHDTQMGNKSYTQFVTEAAKRGRPRKLRPGEEADTLHIQDQLNKLTHPNHVEVHFKDGSKHRIPREHANMALHHLNSLKPIERADHAEHMAKSHNDFYHVLSKKSIPSKKKGISLAGPKLRKEEVEQIDELKRKTLASYVKKAGGTSMDSVGGLMYQAGNADPTAKDNRRVDLFKKAGKRAKGIERAASRLAKEEAELDEAKLSYDDFTKGRVTKDSDSDTLKDMIKKNNKNRGGGSRIMNRKYKEELAKRASVKEEHEDDDGWYAHKEMHGSKAISKEDWKKGVRPKKSMKKEDVEQVVEWGKQAITGPHAKTGSMAITPPKVGYKGKTKKPKVQALTREEASCGSSYKTVKASLMKKANREKDSSK